MSPNEQERSAAAQRTAVVEADVKTLREELRDLRLSVTTTTVLVTDLRILTERQSNSILEILRNQDTARVQAAKEEKDRRDAEVETVKTRDKVRSDLDRKNQRYTIALLGLTGLVLATIVGVVLTHLLL